MKHSFQVGRHASREERIIKPRACLNGARKHRERDEVNDTCMSQETDAHVRERLPESEDAARLCSLDALGCRGK